MTNQDIRQTAVAFLDEINVDITAALPKGVSVDTLRSDFLVAVLNNPKILACDRNSLKAALLKCAVDRLRPDGREAAIIPYDTSIKVDKDRWEKRLLAQYTPMVQGIRKRARELGGIREIFAQVVYENDFFDYDLGDAPFIIHKPPRLGLERGEIQGAYAIFKDDNDHIVHREVMDIHEIGVVKAASKNKDGDLWVKWASEACRKTVVRRGSKSVPTMPDELRRIISRDDEMVDLTAMPIERERVNPLIEPQGQRLLPQGATPPAPTVAPIAPDPIPAATPKGEADAQPPKAAEMPVRIPATLKPVFEALHTTLLRYEGDNVRKGYDAFWKDNKPAGAPVPAAIDLDRELLRLHGLRADGKLSPDDCRAEGLFKIEEAFSDPLS